MPGVTTQLNLEADRAGCFQGANAPYNGKGFAHPKFTAIGLSKDAFAAWVKHARAHGNTLDAGAYSHISVRDVPMHPLYFAHESGFWFNSIVAKYRGKSLIGSQRRDA